jgi:hypothetical protein
MWGHGINYVTMTLWTEVECCAVEAKQGCSFELLTTGRNETLLEAHTRR